MNKGKEVRDRERAKNKGGRGGGKKFSIENEDELALRNEVHSAQRDNRQRRRGDDENESEGEGSNDEQPQKQSTQAAGQGHVFGFASKGKEMASAEDDSEEEDSGIVNQNRQAGGEVVKSRREREAEAAIKAKEDYMRRHLAGETEQAQKDLERLALVRKRREEQAKQREAEGRAPGWSADGIDSDADDDAVLSRPVKAVASAPIAAPLSDAAAKKKAAAAAPAVEEPAAVAADGGPPKLKAMEIKQMNGDALKDNLKARGLPTQGQKKDLIKRLTDYEAGRP